MLNNCFSAYSGLNCDAAQTLGVYVCEAQSEYWEGDMEPSGQAHTSPVCSRRLTPPTHTRPRAAAPHSATHNALVA